MKREVLAQRTSTGLDQPTEPALEFTDMCSDVVVLETYELYGGDGMVQDAFARILERVA